MNLKTKCNFQSNQQPVNNSTSIYLLCVTADWGLGNTFAMANLADSLIWYTYLDHTRAYPYSHLLSNVFRVYGIASL